LDLSSTLQAMASHASAQPASPAAALTPTAAERVMAAELQGRAEAHDALGMMVSSIARMVQVGRSSQSRWKSS
jgi:hypothetical protein